MEPGLQKMLCYASSDSVLQFCLHTSKMKLLWMCYSGFQSGYFILLHPLGVVKGSLLQNYIYQIMASI